MTAGAVFLAALAVALSACGGEGKISREALPELVLQREDVPPLEVFDEGRQTRGDLPPGRRSDPARFGRLDGWKARFRYPGASPRTRGPLVLESRADLFGDSEGASRDLAAARGELDGWERIDGGALGDESWAATTLQEGAVAEVRTFTIAWRHANVVASVLVQGFEGRMSLEDALGLARKQQGRLEDATGG